MDRARDQLLAGACFALDKNGGVRRRDAFDLFEYGFQSRTVAYDLLESTLITILVTGTESFENFHRGPPGAPRCTSLQGSTLKSRANTVEQNFVVERLCQELHRTCP